LFDQQNVSKFRLAILAARRAKQLINGARKRVDMKAENPLTIALEEIRQGKIDLLNFNEDTHENLLDEMFKDPVPQAEEPEDEAVDLSEEEEDEIDDPVAVES
jgi:DNA-directed RNA polymerase subunit omega